MNRFAEALKDVLPQGKFWTHRWHLVSGCTKVSPGCAHCWMETEAGIRQHNPHPTFQTLHAGLLTTEGKWNGTVRMNEHLLDLPLKRHRKPRVWAIWTDLFHEQVTADFRDAVFTRMIIQEQQDWFVIVTKRPEEATRYLTQLRHKGKSPIAWAPIPNVIILVTMEDQERFNKRYPHTAKLAVMGWKVGILAEPLLSGLNLCLDIWPVQPKWIITGGESGHGARPAHPDWFRSLRDQAKAAEIPFMLKQIGEWSHGSIVDRGVWLHLDGAIRSESACGARYMVKSGKKYAGRVLDGVEHLEVPAI